MARKCRKAFGEFRAWPSATLEGTDVAARRIWLINPYLSVSGKRSVSR
jgi:hypothetical protein